ncbi:MAG: TolC family protein [Candidatus Cloacimonadaceae bacterium]
MRKILSIMILLSLVNLLTALSLNEAKQMARERNPEYQAQLNSYKAAQWSSGQALGNMLPSLTLTGNYIYRDPATEIYAGNTMLTMNNDIRSFNLSLSQPIFLGGKLWQSYQISRDSEEMARLTLQNKELSLLTEVESKYYNVLLAQELLSISAKDLQGSKQNLDIAQVRFESGVLSSPEYLRIKSAVATKEVSLIQAQTALELAKQDFMNFLTLSEWTELEPVSLSADEPVIALMADWDSDEVAEFTRGALLTASSNNPYLRIVEMSVSIAKRGYAIARGSFLPSVYLSLSRSYSEDGFERYAFEGSNTLALTASLPLLPFLDNYSAARKAYHEVQKSSFDYAGAENNITLAVRSAALNVISAARQVKASKLALEFTQQTYDQLMERYRANLLSATDLLNAEVMLQSAEMSFANSFYNYFKARSALVKAFGTYDLSFFYSMIYK